MHLFVYGTLRFGDVRWKFLEPFVVNEGEPDTAVGQLFDTGVGYPAALFGGADLPVEGVIAGHRYPLIPEREDEALAVLDEVESAVTGLYHRIQVTTVSGINCWAYQYGLAVDDPQLQLRKIDTGDWFEQTEI